MLWCASICRSHMHNCYIDHVLLYMHVCTSEDRMFNNFQFNPFFHLYSLVLLILEHFYLLAYRAYLQTASLLVFAAAVWSLFQFRLILYAPREMVYVIFFFYSYLFLAKPYLRCALLHVCKHQNFFWWSPFVLRHLYCQVQVFYFSTIKIVYECLIGL